LKIGKNDIRIGNLLRTKDGEEIRVESINNDGINLKITSIINPSNRKLSGLVSIPKYKFDYLCGIDITKDHLVDYGFIHRECGISGADMWQGMDFWTLLNTSFSLRGNPGGLKLTGHINSEILYLHQLQNSYHSTQNKELSD